MPQARAGQFSPSDDGKLIFPSPDFGDKIVVEVLSKTLENYTELPYGTPFPANSPQAALFPNHRLTLQAPQGDRLYVRYYAADRANQNAHNAAISYSGDSESHPIFTRDYIVRRTEYASIDRLSTLTGILSAEVTSGGHDFEDDPVVELSGGTGTGGAITAVVSNGAVVGLTITAAGNYTVAPTITITGGTGATGEVTLQAQTAVLVKEEAMPRTGDERIDGLYILVRYTYETLPGPWLADRDFDPNFGFVQVRRRAVVNTNQASSVTSTLQTTYKARDGSSIVSWEIERLWSDGTGSSSTNGLFPVIPAPIFYDPQRGNVKSFSQVIKSVLKVYSATISVGGTGGTNGTQTVTGTTGTGTKFQASVTVAGNTITAVLSISVAGAYTVRPTDLAQEPVTGASLVGAKLSLTMDASETGTVVIANGIATETSYTPVDEFHIKRIIEYFAVPAVLMSKIEWLDELECDQATWQQLQNTPGSLPAIGSAYSTVGMLSGGAVSSIAIGVDGDSYSQPALVSVARGDGQRALAHSTMKADGIAGYTARGAGFAPGETITTAGTGTASVLTVATTRLVSATIATAGTGGADGAQTATGTTGTGTKFVIAVTVAGGVITATGAISVNGAYTVNPTTLASEPVTVTGGGLTDARLSLVMGVETVTITTGGSLSALPPIELVTATKANAGANYQPLDTITLAGGTGTAPVVFVETVTGTASNGPVATVSVSTPGVLTALPTATDPDGLITRANWTDSGTTTSRVAVGGTVSVVTATDVVTSVAHGRIVGDRAAFDSTLTNPGGISKARAYFVKTVPSADSLTLSTTSGGATLNITSVGSGTITMYSPDATATGGGAGAEFTATYKANISAMNGNAAGTGAIIPITYAVASIVVDAAGSKYGTAPVVTLSGSTGTQATGTATVSSVALAQYTGYVVDRWAEDVKGPLVRVHWKTLPVAELATSGYQTLESTTQWVRPGNFIGPTTFFHYPPWPGIDFSLEQPLSGEFPSLEQTFYKNGPFLRSEMYEPFTMVNPGAASRIFPMIGERTTHNAIAYYLIDGSYAEEFPASTISGRYGDLYCLACRHSRVIGNLYRLKSLFVSAL